MSSESFRPMGSVVLLWVLTTSCATGAVIPPGTSLVDLEENEGLVIIVVDTDTPLASVLFSRDEGIQNFQVARADRGSLATLIRTPAGRYFLTSLRGPNGLYDAPTNGGARICVDVVAGQIANPGALVFRMTGRGVGLSTEVRLGWQTNSQQGPAQVERDWPQLAARHRTEPSACRP